MQRINRTILLGAAAALLLAGWVFYRALSDGSAENARSAASTAGPDAVESTRRPGSTAADPVAERQPQRTASTLLPSDSERRTSDAATADTTSARDEGSSDHVDNETARAELADLRKSIRAADALPGERRVLTNSNLNSVEVMDLMGSDAFSAAVDEFAWDASRDPDAQALTEIYTDFVTRALEAGGEFLLDRLACGLRVCAGQALALSDDASWELHGLYANRVDGPPMYASAYHPYVTSDGRTFYRFMFTIDPESSGIVVGTP